MRQILIDELTKDDVAKLSEWLQVSSIPSEVDGLFWMELTPDLLDSDQSECPRDHPFCYAIELGESWVKFEFLIRSRSNLRSPLARYASPKQLNHIIHFSNRIIAELGLQT